MVAIYGIVRRLHSLQGCGIWDGVKIDRSERCWLKAQRNTIWWKEINQMKPWWGSLKWQSDFGFGSSELEIDIEKLQMKWGILRSSGWDAFSVPSIENDLLDPFRIHSTRDEIVYLSESCTLI